MRDPHVEELRYRVETAANVAYRNPPPIEVDEEEFSGRLEDGIFTCHMKLHYSSVGAAGGVVDQYLRAWEIDADLTLGRGEIRFIYEDTKVIDRNPPPPDAPKVLQVEAVDKIAVSDTGVTLHVTRVKYPDPPRIFRISPDVETLWCRYQSYLDGKEPLLSMAYFCLTVLEIRGGPDPNLKGWERRLAASKMFNIDMAILNKLGALASERGDIANARKAQITAIPLSEKERAWIEATIKHLIRRLGEHGSGKMLPLITMADLLPLVP